MKKVALLSVFFLFLGLAPHVFAEGFVPLAPIPGLTDSVTLNSASGINANTLANFFNNLYKFLIGLAAALAVIMITWEGLRIATNQDNVSIITDSKGKIYNAIFGLVLVLSPVLVFSIINPSILNLSLNLPELDTRSGAPATTIPASRPVLDTNTQLYPCTPDTCTTVRNNCRTSAFTTDTGSYYTVNSEIVCTRSDGTTDPNGRADSWYQSYRCVASESLAVKCTISTVTRP